MWVGRQARFAAGQDGTRRECAACTECGMQWHVYKQSPEAVSFPQACACVQACMCMCTVHACTQLSIQHHEPAHRSTHVHSLLHTSVCADCTVQHSTAQHDSAVTAPSRKLPSQARKADASLWLLTVLVDSVAVVDLGHEKVLTGAEAGACHNRGDVSVAVRCVHS